MTFAKAHSKALQGDNRLHCRFSKRPTPCKGNTKMVLSRGSRFQNFGSRWILGTPCIYRDFSSGRRQDYFRYP